jgi:Asp-tRNA(Asn)/Glu-tRNA(Gln) amidotransferase A subunit family amidase
MDLSSGPAARRPRFLLVRAHSIASNTEPPHSKTKIRCRLCRRVTVGPLQGLPVSIKDLFAAAGYPCFAGSSRRLAAHPVLVEVTRRETTNHLLALFRNRR